VRRALRDVPGRRRADGAAAAHYDAECGWRRLGQCRRRGRGGAGDVPAQFADGAELCGAGEGAAGVRVRVSECVSERAGAGQ